MKMRIERYPRDPPGAGVFRDRFGSFDTQTCPAIPGGAMALQLLYLILLNKSSNTRTRSSNYKLNF
jgi:hypothetical protein